LRIEVYGGRYPVYAAEFETGGDSDWRIQQLGDSKWIAEGKQSNVVVTVELVDGEWRSRIRRATSTKVAH
jgi:hypothetical protein